MRGWKALGTALLVIAALAPLAYAQSKGRHASLGADDYAEIQRLYARYAWALDSRAGNGAAYASVYTPDGEFVYGTTKTVGRDKLAVQFGSSRNPSAKVSPHHFVTNLMISPTEGGARGSAYVLVVTAGEAGKAPSIAGGTYSDLLVKTGEGWRFKRREIVMDGLIPAGLEQLLSMR